ncbi:Host cell surface-exposed lipoprotein [Burkholderia multivorans]|uniref:Host cell surface-exposed lipoprotein n=1 Tax=Burkholderia multivorans TaxID=87883 RepID=A0ABD7LIR0_9BURK|nr:Ltp family lipoprotein [Burkholderia multivorans]MCA7960075.1 Ltp family lipoprotein [Burkholderia multivorans]MCL4651960.1 Ltp family lipoprotein [Burkholderia multivorans]MCL4654815.1 Ltp family lipoprotein [Burkholderia multivorans]MCO1342636.1 Ltp family lipoprotein [Burkholderia multivorans]MCO1426465.1 Ltp family lipoprotein [Burkholderia multivorans]
MNIWGFVTILVLDFIVASYASHKGKSKGFWFLMSILVSPLVSWVILFFSKPSQNSEKSGDKHVWGHAAAATLAILIGGYLTFQPPTKDADIPTRAANAPEVAIAEAATVQDTGLTAPQNNAVRSAKQYLSMQGFSRAGLIHQLSSDAGEGFDVADATAAVDSLHVDWNQQAVRSAKQYLSMQGFSCKGLIHQLSSDAGEGYTPSQADYGAKQAGAC